MKGNRVLLITPGILPVPAVWGGAVETLAESLVRQNEVHQEMQLTVFGIWEPRAEQKAQRYRHTEFVFVRLPLKDKIADFGVYSYLEYIKKDWKSMFYQNFFQEKYYTQKAAEYLHSQEFDWVIFENRLSLLSALRLYGNSQKYAGKYAYHQHSAVLDTKTDRDLFVKCRKILAVSGYVREDILKQYPEITQEQVITVQNGVNRKVFGRKLDMARRERTRRGLGVKEETVFFYSGRLSQEKGVLEMVRAFKKAIKGLKDGKKRAKLLIAGGCFSGKRQKNAYYRKLFWETKGFEASIRLLGFLPYEKMNDYYEAADVLLIPTLVPDAAPLALLEGMMGPGAVVASKVGGIPEYAGEKGAMLVTMDEKETGIRHMSDAIRQCIQKPERIEAYAGESRKWGRQFTCRSYYKDTLRALGLGQEEKEKQRPIAFLGTGRYAAAAVGRFQEEGIGCFVNFSPSLAGEEILGYPVLEAAQFLPHASQYRLILISTFQDAIIKKLEEWGITEYTYYSPAFEKALQALADSGAGAIGVYGGANAALFCQEIKARTGIEEVYPLDEGAGPAQLSMGKDKLDAIFIGDGRRHAALTARAMREKAPHTVVINPFRQALQFATEELVIHPYGIGGAQKSEQEWNRRQKEHGRREEINAYVEEVHEDVPLFEMIEIETINQCNGTCAFCPVNCRDDTREPRQMGMELFQKIILDLKGISYQGHLALFSNNEPFLDKGLEEKAMFAREQLPGAKIHVFTNGTVLTLERFIRIIPYLDELVIDNYSRKLELHDTSRAVVGYCTQHPELKEKVTVVIRDPMEILTTRGGDAPNRTEKISYPSQRCALPFQQMVVRPDGKLSLCCNDPLGKETLGDLARQGVLEAWHSPEYARVREALFKGRGNLGHCRYCDTFDLY
ncbi:MAG: glycosyltransferase [Lachnospiraceae bacterium]|jgi:glycosyltransferase involved in cell wall biosynthesis|nr:glycosyltransferase [Lachnospiraceae bacterium]